MPRKLFTAILRSASGVASVDADAGVILGVKLMELGKLARFAGEGGKAKQVTITNEHISALLSHAGNRSIPIHDSHEWFDSQDKPNADSMEMNARIGALKAFRRDDSGNLIADAHLNKAKPAALDLLWGAQSNPEDNCFSVVFNYLKDDPNCIPQNFRAGDRVPSGAATTALFSEDNNQTTMDISELIAALADPKVQAAVKAIIKSHTDDADASGDAATAEMESDADVKPEDKKPEDAQKPALMRRLAPIVRALSRKMKSVSTDETALLAKVETKIQASETALLGKNKFLNASTGSDAATDGEAFITAQLANSCPNRATAIARMAKDKPLLYATFRS